MRFVNKIFAGFILACSMAGIVHAQPRPLDILSLKPGDTRVQFEKTMEEQKCRILPSSFFSAQTSDGTDWSYFLGTECKPEGNMFTRDFMAMLSSPKTGEIIYLVGFSQTFQNKKGGNIREYLEFQNEKGGDIKEYLSSQNETGANIKEYLDKVFALYGEPDGQFSDEKNKDEGYFWIRNQEEGNERSFAECMLVPDAVPDLDYMFQKECGTILTLRIHKENDTTMSRSFLQLVDHSLASRIRLMDD